MITTSLISKESKRKGKTVEENKEYDPATEINRTADASVYFLTKKHIYFTILKATLIQCYGRGEQETDMLKFHLSNITRRTA
jgi:hypothetical protein